MVRDGGFQAVIQLVRSAGTIILGILGPFLGLGLGDEFTEHIHIDALGNIMLTSMYPIALGILSAKLSVTTFWGNQEGFYISLKSFLAYPRYNTPLHLSDFACKFNGTLTKGFQIVLVFYYQD